MIARGGEEGLAARLEQFMQDPARQALIAARVDKGLVYDAAVEELSAKDNEAAPTHTAVSSHEKSHKPPISVTDRLESYIPNLRPLLGGW